MATSNITVKDLSPDQREAYEAITHWMRAPSSGLLTLAGYAGSGKSTVTSLIAEQCDLPAFCAYTGKATSILRRKLAKAGTATVGVQRKSRDGVMSDDERPYCGTIHSLIYHPCSCREPAAVEVQKPCPEKKCTGETTWQTGLGETAGRSVCANGHVGLVKSQKAFEALKPQTRFTYAKKDESDRCMLCGGKEWLRREALDRAYSLIIVDEASMVDDMMLRDLRSYGVPILAVGDHGQLPPVGGNGSLMKNPELRLEKIHRQAEGNPIIALSKIIRETGRIPDSFDGGDAVVFERLRFLDRILEDRYAEADAARMLAMGCVAYTNRRRIGVNAAVRRARGLARTGRELPRAGEHIVCLRNIKEGQGRPPIANGMRGVLEGDVDWKLIRDQHGDRKLPDGTPARESETQLLARVEFPEDEIAAYDFEMFGPQFMREKTFSSSEELARDTGIHSFAMAGALFDFGYCMTGHKMQGSSVEDLAAIIERPGPVSDDDWRRWCYTVTTRAEKKLTILR